MTARELPRGLAWLGALAIGWALLIALSGGIATSVAGVRISSRDAMRPLLLGLLLLGIAAWRLPADERHAWRSALTGGMRRGLPALAAAVDRAAAPLAAATAAVVLVASLVFGVHGAVAADPFGYVSQSALWRAGQHVWPVEVLTPDPWPASGWQVSPLGYGPSQHEGRLAYIYSPGVPWLMALLRVPFGDAGPYLLTPLLGALWVWLCFVFVRARAGPAPALAATLLVASSPPFLFQMMWPMSDVPTAALWLAVLVRLPPVHVTHALVTGGLAGLALLVRPNLALVAAAVWLATAAGEYRGGVREGRHSRLIALVVPVLLAGGLVALLNHLWRGSPLASGYGTLHELFGAEYVARNVRQQWLWLLETDSIAVMIGVLALPWLAWRGPHARAWWPGAALALMLWVSYVGYGDFTEWWYLRFHLPAWAVLTGAACVAVTALLARRSPAAATLAVLALAGAGALHGVRLAHDVNVFGLWRDEQRYVAAGQWLQAHTSSSAVVLAMQHSGTVGYYGARAVIRYDFLAPEALDATIAALAAAGRPAYLVVDD
jgi:hypothetical protein